MIAIKNSKEDYIVLSGTEQILPIIIKTQESLAINLCDSEDILYVNIIVLQNWT